MTIANLQTEIKQALADTRAAGLEDVAAENKLGDELGSHIFDNASDPDDLSSPPPIGDVTPNTGKFTNVELTGADPSIPNANTIYKKNSIGGACLYNHTADTVLEDYNVLGVNDDSAGNFTITWDTDFSDANYFVSGGLASRVAWRETGKAAGTLSIRTFNSAFAQGDDSGMSIIAVGEQ